MTCPRSPCFLVLFSHKREVNREPRREGQVDSGTMDSLMPPGTLGVLEADADAPSKWEGNEGTLVCIIGVLCHSTAWGALKLEYPVLSCISQPCLVWLFLSQELSTYWPVPSCFHSITKC